MRLMILIACVGFASAADPPDTKLPPEASKVVAERDTTIAKAKAAYDAAVAKANAEAAKKLDPILVKITKSGDLAGANAVKAKLDELKTGQADLLGDAPVDLAKILIKNKWILSTGFEKVPIVFQANGTTGSRVKEYAKWKLENGTLSIIWDTDVVECQMKFDQATNSFIQDDALKAENRDKARVHALTIQQSAK